ncbi:MAG: YIP1 family protein [Alphaproteobacteria bacterium]|nr:YIP1 family protein [Alphaproteobacteria bacterium]
MDIADLRMDFDAPRFGDRTRALRGYADEMSRVVAESVAFARQTAEIERLLRPMGVALETVGRAFEESFDTRPVQDFLRETRRGADDFRHDWSTAVGSVAGDIERLVSTGSVRLNSLSRQMSTIGSAGGPFDLAATLSTGTGAAASGAATPMPLSTRTLIEAGLETVTPGAALTGVGGNRLGNALFGDGGTASTVASAILGAVGTYIAGPIGAFVGSFIGQFIGSLFGGDKDFPYADVQAQGGRVISSTSLDGGDATDLRQLIDTRVEPGLEEIRAGLGLERAPDTHLQMMRATARENLPTGFITTASRLSDPDGVRLFGFQSERFRAFSNDETGAEAAVADYMLQSLRNDVLGALYYPVRDKIVRDAGLTADQFLTDLDDAASTAGMTPALIERIRAAQADDRAARDALPTTVEEVQALMAAGEINTLQRAILIADISQGDQGRLGGEAGENRFATPEEVGEFLDYASAFDETVGAMTEGVRSFSETARGQVRDGFRDMERGLEDFLDKARSLEEKGGVVGAFAHAEMGVQAFIRHTLDIGEAAKSATKEQDAYAKQLEDIHTTYEEARPLLKAFFYDLSDTEVDAKLALGQDRSIAELERRTRIAALNVAGGSTAAFDAMQLLAENIASFTTAMAEGAVTAMEGQAAIDALFDEAVQDLSVTQLLAVVETLKLIESTTPGVTEVLSGLTEHLAIWRDGADRAAQSIGDLAALIGTPANDNRPTLVQALAQAATAAENAAGRFRTTALDLKAAAESLLLDANLSPLDPIGRRDEAFAQFNAAAAAAQSGDIEAAAGLAEIARAYLEAEREVSASGADYAAAFALVRNVLSETGMAFDNHAAVFESQAAGLSQAAKDYEAFVIRIRLATADGVLTAEEIRDIEEDFSALDRLVAGLGGSGVIGLLRISIADWRNALMDGVIDQNEIAIIEDNLEFARDAFLDAARQIGEGVPVLLNQGPAAPPPSPPPPPVSTPAPVDPFAVGDDRALAYAARYPDLGAHYDANRDSIQTATGAGSLADFARLHYDLFGRTEGREFAQGGVFTNHVVEGPTHFPMGLMGEAGPEAILPLANVGGALGVRSTNDNADMAGRLDRITDRLDQLAKIVAEGHDETVGALKEGNGQRQLMVRSSLLHEVSR